MNKIILASNSPRRKEILQNFGYDFEVIVSDYEEKTPRNLNSEKAIISLIKNNCYCKAKTVAENIATQAIVIGADTVVTLDSVCLLKPQDFSEAFLFLNKLSNRVHSVKTAITLIMDDIELTRVCETKVGFRKLGEQEILQYIEKFQPFDKAGAYGIQDFLTYEQSKCPPQEISKQSFVNKIKGSYYNVMGICPFEVQDMLEIVRGKI